MKKLINEMANLLSSEQSFALATVVSRNGSAPRSAGARMLVRADGSTMGTVGGGILEAQVEQLANRVIRSHVGTLQRFSFSGKDAATMDAICGGNVEVLIEWIDSGSADLQAIVTGLQEQFSRRQRVWLVTRLEGEGSLGMQSLSTVDGQIYGHLPVGFEAGWTSRLTGHGNSEIVRQGKERYFIEPLDSGKMVFIFGAGHVSQALAAFTHAVGFKTIVLDDRAEYASRERFPEAEEIIVLNAFSGALSKVQIDPDSFIVIVTRGHLNDREVLAQCLHTEAAYIGMIGSRRKCALIFDQLRKEGHGEEEIQRVHAPIGLPMDAETPEEIGISIVAEMIQARAQLNGRV